MNPENINEIVLTIIEGMDWEFIISCYGPEDYKLKYVVAKTIQKDGKTIETFEYVQPTLEMLQQDLVELLVTVIQKNYHQFYYGHWAIKQVSGEDMKDNYGDSIEVMFSPCRYTVIEDKKISKQNRRKKNTEQKIKSIFKDRLKFPDKFNALLAVEKNVQTLEEMLKTCLDPKNEDYESASKIHSRLQELKK